MILNSTFMIHQAKCTHISEVEVMYWILESALYNGDISKAKIMLEFLLYLAKYRKTHILNGLQSPHRKRLQAICYELLSNKYVVEKQAIIMKPAIKKRKTVFKLEKDLRNYLLKNPNVLMSAVDKECRITGSEVDTEEDYRCDITAESKTHFYPVELKIAQANHQVVSQCSKYCFYFYRQLRYDRFKHVQGVVIASGFDKWSINELRRDGHWIYNIVPEKDRHISLRQIG